MTQFFMLFLLISNSLFFLFMSHPLTMGLMLMIQTLMMAIFTGYYNFFFWFSYSLFLIFMGGMLILFMYMTSLASNEIFNFKLKLNFFFWGFIIIMMFIMVYTYWNFNSYINNKVFNKDLMDMTKIMMFYENNSFLLNKLYNFPTNLITIMLVNYLFLTLIASVKITNIFKGPLRPKFN